MEKILEELTGKIKDKSARIGVIGLGYVGLPLVLRFCEEGFSVTGFDVDATKVTALCEGRSYIKHIPSSSIEKSTGSGNFTATTVMSGLGDCDAVIICVPTPLNKTREPEMKYVVETAKVIAKHLRPGQLISLESTTYPGTTEELLQTRFEEKGLKAGVDFFLVFSPEREDPGRKDFSTSTIPKVVGGTTPACLQVGSLLYSQVIEKVVEVSSTKAAEMTKLLENIYRCVNIALVNELKMLTERMDIDIWEVIKASSTKPFGFQPFYPGPGLGGHCIPIDPFYLSWKAKQFDFSTKFIELAGEINAQMPLYVVGKVFEALNMQGKAVKGSRILILGLAYKKDVDDVRESPSLVLIELLRKLGAEVAYNDPHVPATHKMRNHDLAMESIELSAENIKSYDCVLIATDHSDYDYEWIVKNSNIVVDTRGATNNIKCENVLRA
ncbi:UDP-N-acetyl-D-glucosamine 6-dehydrogenase [hydrothermal vent metagenome]|uniref:UDP-N-acetyl-D-glucosamine 6-dehydrogenase n=1 Tax=hydrothermal vent metagenome TaxID=652676 RepID=A0A3B0QWI4_9ZZZZ